MADDNTDDDHAIMERFKVFEPNSDTVCTEAFSKFLIEFRSHSDLFFSSCMLSLAPMNLVVSPPKLWLALAGRTSIGSGTRKCSRTPNLFYGL